MRRIRPSRRVYTAIRLGAAIATMCLSGGAFAETVVLDHFTLIDGTGRAPVADQALVMTNGRITWVGPSRRRPAAAKSATTEDLRGKYLMPGIIDALTRSATPFAAAVARAEATAAADRSVAMTRASGCARAHEVASAPVPQPRSTTRRAFRNSSAAPSPSRPPAGPGPSCWRCLRTCSLT